MKNAIIRWVINIINPLSLNCSKNLIKTKIISISNLFNIVLTEIYFLLMTRRKKEEKIRFPTESHIIL